MSMDLLELDDESQIKELTVKQLKVVLKKNCIDFKGCVEKQELTERVKRLWLAKKKEKGAENGRIRGRRGREREREKEREREREREGERGESLLNFFV